MQYRSLIGAGALLLSTFCNAQTYTTCDPMNATCPNDPALGISHNFVFNTSSTVTNSFNITAGSLVYADNGTTFTVAKKGDSSTIQSKFYIFWGSVSVVLQAAPGQGIISSIVLESDDLDEVDWEILGGNGTHAETNYFGKGNTTSYDRAIYYPVGADPRTGFHNYSVSWTQEKLEWYIDSNLVRTLNYADANSGYNYPQTPMTVRIGIWAGGDPDLPKGTIEWAGGETDYTKGPYNMYLQSAQINDFSTGKEYQWTDKTGSFDSIKSISGNSTVATTIAKAASEKPAESAAEKWANLSSTTKLAVYAGSGGAAALLVTAFLFVFIRQRRAGRQEREAYNAKVEQERTDTYKDQMELREKGLGGFDEGSYANQGDDALGGWGGTHVPADMKAAAFEAKQPMHINTKETDDEPYTDGRSPRPESPPYRTMSPIGQTPQRGFSTNLKGGYQRF